MKKYLLISILTFGFSSNSYSAACVNTFGGGQTCYDDLTITTGATAQNLFGGIVPRNGYDIKNPDATEDCWVSDSATAAPNGTGSYRLQANGGWYESPPGKKPPLAVSIYCATTGHKITASRW